MEKEIRLDQKIGNISRRQHLLQIGSQTGNYSDELVPDIIPDAGMNVWTAFLDLSSARGSFGGMGGELRSISYAEIEAYKRLMRIELLPSEISLIRRLDTVYLNAISKDGSSKSTSKHKVSRGKGNNQRP